MPRGRKKTTGNGHSNGNGNGFAFAPSSVKTNAQGQLVIDDLVPAQVLVMFFIQKLGKSSEHQIAEKLEAAAVEMNRNLLEQAIEGLRGRGFVSIGKGTDSSGERVDQFRARRAMWTATPDVAQVSQSFLSELVATDDARELLGQLNEAEEEGDGTAKAKEKLKYGDYYVAQITFQTTTADDGASGCMLGGRPASPAMERLIEMGPAHPKECNLRFPRNNDGQPVVPISNIRGWLATCLYKYRITPAAIGRIGIRGGVIEFSGKIRQHSQQVVDLSGGGRGGGRGITEYECIDAGARITFTFNVPKRGVGTYEQFIAWVMAYAPQSERGLSNARSNEYGFVEVVDYKMLGSLADAHSAIGTIESRLSDAGKAAMERFKKETLKGRNLNLFNGQHIEIE